MVAADKTPEAIEIWIQFGAAGLMVAIMALIHGLGLVGITKAYDLSDERLEKRDFDVKAILLMGVMALSLFVLHVLEIWAFALFYMAVDAIHSLEEALYYSASAYATLGYTADYFPQEWRLLGASEGLAGFLMLGWSTAFLVHNINKLRE